jgi:hypothetical protein
MAQPVHKVMRVRAEAWCQGSGGRCTESCGSVAPAHRSTATGRILLQGNGIGAPGAKHRLDDPPRLDGLVATH